MDRDDLLSCVESGMSTTQIASKFNKGQTTIRYWLKKYNLRTIHKSFSDGYSDHKKVNKDNQYCSSCKVKLTEENAYGRKARECYISLCKSCRCKYTLKRRRNFKQKCVTYKGGKCIKCDYNKNLTSLEFHHVNSQEKEYDPSKMVNKSWDYAKSELDKCVLLCSNCHREEHYVLNLKKAQEKLFNNNFLDSFSDKILTGKNTGKKSCRQCDKVLTEENIASGTHKHSCKSCDSKNVVESGINGKKRCVDYMGGKCSICSYDKCIIALEFHHIDPSKKSPTYNKRFRYWGFERQKKELENCILVCSNCHREIHSKDEWKT